MTRDPKESSDHYIRWSKYYFNAFSKDYEDIKDKKFETQLDRQYKREVHYEFSKGWVPKGDKPHSVRKFSLCGICTRLYFAVRKLFS